MSQPQLWVIAGPNGAGKSTLTKRYLNGRLTIINPDEIAVRIDPTRSGKVSTILQAGRQALEQRQDHLRQRKSFGVETTLTGRSELDLMRQAKIAGYKVNLVYVGIGSAGLSATRVAARVARGGHNIPPDDIMRRYGRSIDGLKSALAIVDRAYVLDNSGKRRRLLMVQDGTRQRVVSRDLPSWAKDVVPQQQPTLPRRPSGPARGPGRGGIDI